LRDQKETYREKYKLRFTKFDGTTVVTIGNWKDNVLAMGDEMVLRSYAIFL
jgi:hypothetical protein